MLYCPYNTSAIKKELSKNNIKVKDVHRHGIWGINVYVIRFHKDDNNKHINDKILANALNIPIDWVGLAQCTSDGYCTYWIKEDKLNNKYCDDDGKLVFENPFNLKDYPFKEKFETLCPIKVQLEKHGIVVEEIGIWDDFLMIKLETNECGARIIQKALDIHSHDIEIIQSFTVYAVNRWDK